jgi:hypothetical protein
MWKQSFIVPIYKKSHRADCNNYFCQQRTEFHPTSCCEGGLKKITGYRDCRFRRSKSSIDHTSYIRQIFEKKLLYNEKYISCF